MPYQVRGGEDQHVESLVDIYRGLGHEPQWAPRAPSIARGAGHSLLGGAEAQWAAWRRERGVGFVHLHNLHPSFGPGFLRWLARERLPALWTIHNHRFYCTNGLAFRAGRPCQDCRPARSFWRPVRRNCNEDPAKTLYHSLALWQIREPGLLDSFPGFFLAPSPYIESELRAAGLPAAKIRLLPHFVSLPPPSAPEVAPEPLHCVYAGRLSPEKGVRHLLRLAAANPQWRIGILGHGPLAHEVAAAAQANPNILFRSELSRPELFALVRQAKVALVPSDCPESFSLFAAESLASGLRLVVAEGESLRWYTEKPYGAIGANFSDPSSAAAAINPALALGGGDDRGARAAEFTEVFSSRVYGARLARLLEEACALV